MSFTSTLTFMALAQRKAATQPQLAKSAEILANVITKLGRLPVSVILSPQYNDLVIIKNHMLAAHAKLFTSPEQSETPERASKVDCDAHLARVKELEERYNAAHLALMIAPDISTTVLAPISKQLRDSDTIRKTIDALLDKMYDMHPSADKCPKYEKVLEIKGKIQEKHAEIYTRPFVDKGDVVQDCITFLSQQEAFASEFYGAFNELYAEVLAANKASVPELKFGKPSITG